MRSILAIIASSLVLAALPLSAQTHRASEVTLQRSGSSYLGISVADINPDRAKALNLKEDRGAEVKTVEDDSPAAKAGVKVGDVVLEYNSTPVEGTEELERLVHETPAGRQVKLVVWRNGASQTLTAMVGARKATIIQTPQGTFTLPNMPPMPAIPGVPPVEIPRFQMAWQNPMLGIEGESLGEHEQLAAYFGVKDGVLVKWVGKNTPAEKAGIKAGDVIVKVDGAGVTNTREITSQLRGARSRKNVSVTLVRDKKELSITVNLDDQVGSAFPVGGAVVVSD